MRVHPVLAGRSQRGRKEIAVTVQRGVNDDGDRENLTDDADVELGDASVRVVQGCGSARMDVSMTDSDAGTHGVKLCRCAGI